jgi:hypothetical protein
MIKRLQENYDAEVLSGRSEPDSKTEEHAPPSKRRRILDDLRRSPELGKEANASWRGLPAELQNKIFRDLIDPSDIKSTLKNLTAFKRTTKSLKNIVDHELFDKDFILLLSGIMNEYNEILDTFDLEDKSHNRGSFRLNNMTVEADFLPIRTTTERSVIVNYILNYKDADASKDAMRNLIRNIDYTKSGEKVRIVNYVCGDEIEEGIAKDLVFELIKKAEYLGPKECASLAKKSCHIQDYERYDWRGLEAWAPKMDLLDEYDQANILSHDNIHADKSFFPHFAKYIDKAAKENRPQIVKHIVELPSGHPGKFEALSHLAKNLNCLDIHDRPKIISSILDNFGKSTEQSVDEQRWYSKPEFCEIEAVHYLSTHKEFLRPPERGRVKSLIDTIISQSDPAAFGAKSQLITHMSEEERSNVIKTALEQNDTDTKDRVICGLTARIKNLTEDDLSRYMSHVSRRSDDNKLYGEIVTYNIRNNFELFDEDQRSILVKRQARNIYESGPSFANEFEYIAENAKYLSNIDVNYTIKMARRVANKYIDNGNPTRDGANASSIRSCAGYAARCAANWAREAAASATVYEEDALVHDDQLNRTANAHQRAETASARGYNERSREPSFER